MKTLIINLGPPGDVVRTTVMHRIIEGEIHWLTKARCSDILSSPNITKIWLSDKPEDIQMLKTIEFDRVINLNEEREAVELVKNLRYKKFTGIYSESGTTLYTPDCASWLDMSLISKHGKETADRLKRENKSSVAQLYVEIAGGKWDGHEYDLGVEPLNNGETKGTIGLINVETGKWANKLWYGYDELAEKLRAEGYNVKYLGMRRSIREHIDDINKCEMVVSGDTLGMHVALALKKKAVALFNCTPPQEIHEYGRLKKVVSPLCWKFMFDKEYNPDAMTAITVDEVYSAVKETINSK